MGRLQRLSLFRTPDVAESPASQWPRSGRVAAASTLVLGGVLNAGMWLALGSNLDSHETIDYLRWIAAHPDRANLAAALGLLAMPFLFGTALVYVLLSRKRSPRLAYSGGILLGCGFFGLSVILGSEIPVARLAQNGGIDLTALSSVSDHTLISSAAPSIVLALLFFPGAVFGLLTMAVALWRSCAVPRGAVVLIAAFVVLDFGLQLAVPAHLILAAAAFWMASAVLRAGSASQPVAQSAVGVVVEPGAAGGRPELRLRPEPEG